MLVGRQDELTAKASVSHADRMAPQDAEVTRDEVSLNIGLLAVIAIRVLVVPNACNADLASQEDLLLE